MAKFTRSAASIAVEKRLSEGSPGQEISVRDMEAITGLPCDGSKARGWQIVAGLIPKMERHHSLIWRWKKDLMSWLCEDDQGKTSDVRYRTGIIQRRARRNRTVIEAINFDNLDEKHKRMAIVCAIVSNAVETLTAGRNVKRLESTASKPFLPDEEALLRLCRERENGR